jgi:sensor histidine kinase regulating citrate/malate metabolism
VELSVAVEQGRLVIAISDTGSGLSGGRTAGEAPRPGGHGLGLGLCRQVVSELGGRLALTPGHGGRGGVLRVDVPLGSLREP